MFHAVEYIEFIIVRLICAAKITNNLDISKQIGEKNRISCYFLRLSGDYGGIQDDYRVQLD
jgi:hypothetical protein